jgi:hypothetical protein
VEARMESKDRACNLLDGTLKDAIGNLEQAKECMAGWDWEFISPEDIEEVLETLKKIIEKVEMET